MVNESYSLQPWVKSVTCLFGMEITAFGPETGRRLGGDWLVSWSKVQKEQATTTYECPVLRTSTRRPGVKCI